MAIAVVQNNAQASGSTSTAAVASWGATPTLGNLLIAIVGNTTTNALPTTVQGIGAAYTLIGSSQVSSALSVSIWARIAGASEPTNVAATLASNRLFLNLYEISGAATSVGSLLDGTPSATGTNLNTATTSGSQPSVTTLAPTSMVIATMMSGVVTAQSVTAGSGSTTPGLEQFNGGMLQDAMFVETSAGTYAPFFSWTTARKWSALTLAVLPASASYTGSPAETLSTADSIVRAEVAARGVAETNSTVDNIARAVLAARALTETLSTADAAARSLASTRAPSEALTTQDQLARVSVLVRAITESLSTADSVATGGHSPARTLADTLTTADTLGRAAALTRAMTETFTTSDSLAHALVLARALTETLTTLDSVARAAVMSRAMAETKLVTESVARMVGFARSLVENLATADVVARVAHLTRGITETLAFLDHVTVIHTAPTVPGHGDVLLDLHSQALLTSVLTSRGDAVGILASSGIVTLGAS